MTDDTAYPMTDRDAVFVAAYDAVARQGLGPYDAARIAVTVALNRLLELGYEVPR